MPEDVCLTGLPGSQGEKRKRQRFPETAGSPHSAMSTWCCGPPLSPTGQDQAQRSCPRPGPPWLCRERRLGLFPPCWPRPQHGRPEHSQGPGQAWEPGPGARGCRETGGALGSHLVPSVPLSPVTQASPFDIKAQELDGPQVNSSPHDVSPAEVPEGRLYLAGPQQVSESTEPARC